MYCRRQGKDISLDIPLEIHNPPVHPDFDLFSPIPNLVNVTLALTFNWIRFWG